MIFQSTESLDKYLDGIISRKLRKGITPSLSALFRNARKKPSVSYIGDYPLLLYCFTKTRQHGITYNRSQINHAINQSEELSASPISFKSWMLNFMEELQTKTIHNCNETSSEQAQKKERSRNG